MKLTHSKHPHVVLETCGHRVCAIDGVNASRGKIEAGHIRELERFHAAIHKAEAKWRAADEKRSGLADGRIEGRMGGRLAPRQVRNDQKAELAPFIQQRPKNEKANPFPLRSKFVGKSRKKIPAGYRPRRRKSAEVPMATA